MFKDSQDQNSTSSQQEVEQHIKSMLGPYPEEAEKPPEEVEEKPAEKTLVIKDSGTMPTQPPGAPPVGAVITPNEPMSADDSAYMDMTTATDDRINEAEAAVDDAQQEDAPELPSSNEAAAKPPKPPKTDGKLKRFFKAWWHNRVARWATIIVLVAGILTATFYPTSRYFLLNNVGVRSSATVTVLDNSTQLPLKNVQVSLANTTGQTNSDGQVKLEHIKLGKTNLTVSKRAFANFSQPVTIGWGSNPLGSFPIKAVGAQYRFTVTDYLSGKAIAKAEASSGDANAQSDDKGKILLTIDPSEISDNMTVKISADGYRDEQAVLGTDTTATAAIKMVPARKEVFMSNRSGHYDLYTIDIDGKNEKLVLAGTGLERDDMVLVPQPTDEVAALVSSRVNIRNSDGFLLSTLTMVGLKDSSTISVAQSERIQIVGWVGQRLIFVQIAAGASAADPGRFRLMSYDYKTADKKELARANSFNDVILVGASIYYAPSSAYQTDPSVGLIKISADGSSKQSLLDKEVWNIFRDSYDTLDLSVGQDWYQYKFGDSSAIKLSQAPVNSKSRIYIANPNGTHNLWVDQRDGKGVLLDYTPSSAIDKILQTQSGLGYPVRWLTNSTFIYRAHTDAETADYVMSIDGGSTHKISDVYNAGGIDRWYYY